MKKHIFSLVFCAFLAAVFAACLSVKVSEPSACDGQSISFPAPAVPPIPSQYQDTATCALYSVSLPSESTTTQVDLSDTLSKIGKVASNLTVNVNALSIENTNNVLGWVHGVKVQISSSSMPMAELATYNMPEGGAGETLEPTITMSGTDIYNYLSSGPVTLTLTLQGQTVNACDALLVSDDVSDGGLNSTINLCISASGQVKKSL